MQLHNATLSLDSDLSKNKQHRIEYRIYFVLCSRETHDEDEDEKREKRKQRNEKNNKK